MWCSAYVYFDLRNVVSIHDVCRSVVLVLKCLLRKRNRRIGEAACARSTLPSV